MKRVLSVFGVGLVAASTVVAAVGVQSAAATTPVHAAASAPGRYVSVTPARALDSRTQGGAFVQGEVRSLDLSSIVPPTATAVVLNLTATAPTQPGYLTVWPSDAPQPTASSLNKKAGETRSNSVTVALPSDPETARSVKIFNQAGSTQVVVDVFGYYDSSTSTGVSYYPQPGIRAFDSREPGPASGVYGPGDSVEIPTAWTLSGVTALALNVTAVTPDGPGYLTTWNGDGPQPGTSTVNYEAARVTPNFTVVPVTSTETEDGVIDSFAVGNNVSDSDIVVDVVGVYATSGQRVYATSYVPVTPQRLSDTRNTGVLGPNQTYDTRVPGANADFWAANLNVTAVEPSASTYLTVYASDLDKPDTSTLNADPGDVVPNATQPLLDTNGFYRVYNASGYVNVVADLEGYFVSDSEGKSATPAAVGSDARPTTVAAARQH